MRQSVRLFHLRHPYTPSVHRSMVAHAQGLTPSEQSAPGGGGNEEDAGSKVYERKDDAYFGYYALLSHQAQMLQVSALWQARHSASSTDKLAMTSHRTPFGQAPIREPF